MRKPEIRGGLLVFLVYLFATCIATLGMYFSITDYVFYNTVHAWLCILVFFLKAAGIVFFFRRSSFFPYLHAGYEILWLILYLSIEPSRYPSTSAFIFGSALIPLIGIIYLFISERAKFYFGRHTVIADDTKPTVSQEKYSFPSIYGTPKSTETDVSDAPPSDNPAQTDAPQGKAVLPETEAAPSEPETEPSSASPVSVSSADVPPKKKTINKTAVVITAIVCVTAIALVCLFMFGSRPASPASAPLPSPSVTFPSVVGTWELDKIVIHNTGDDNGVTLSKEQFLEYAGYSDISEYGLEFESDGNIILYVNTYQISGTWEEVGLSYIAKFPSDDNSPYRFVLDDNTLTLEIEADDGLRGTLYFEKQ